jgi:hypothetical protein
MRWAIPFSLLLPLAAAGFVPPAAADPACIEVANNTAFWMPGSIRAPGTKAIGFKIDANRSRYVCLSLDLPRGTPLEVMIKSGWGLPIGTCDLPLGVIGVRVQIDRIPGETSDENVVKVHCG